MTMPIKNRSGVEETRFPVSVLMAHEQITMGQWSVPRWRVVGVVAGEPDAGDQSEEGRLVHDEDGKQEYLWSGFEIRLYRDATESYWLNLVGQQPSLFVVCREDQTDGRCDPIVVTANYDEAGAYMEADATVMSAPMPPEVYRWLEHYVVEHFQPAEGKSRRREPWFDAQAEQLPPRGRRH